MRREGNLIIAEPGEKWDHSLMTVNRKRFQIMANIRNNIRRQLPQLQGYGGNPERVAVVGSGWSLLDTFDELRDLYFSGVKIAALNGAANWLMAQNIRPSVVIMLDARPENIDFVREPIPRCQYFFASQIDPCVLDLCEDRDVTLFHGIAANADMEIARLNHYYGEGRWIRVPPGGTVGITSVMVLRILGFEHQHLFGFDSCYSPKDRKHHAFPQALNDGEGTGIFKIAEKEFECSTWQASQVTNFLEMMRENGSLLDLTIHGDGLLAHVVKYGCDLEAHELKEA